MENPIPQKPPMDYPDTFPRSYMHSPKSYALSGRIMLGAIVVLFTVVLLILCLHIYARCYLLRRRRRQLLLRRRSRLVFVSHLQQAPPADAAPHRGLDVAILRSLPVFSFSSKTHPEPLECAVCLSEFEEGEKGRLLPKCNHSFHTDCIDMWFHSHSTCPLCRSPVQPMSADLPPSIPEHQVEVLVSGEEGSSPRPTSNSARLCSSCQQTEELGVPAPALSSSSSARREESTAASSPSFRKKAFGFVGMGIEVPRRNESFKGREEEVGIGSPLRSPGGGILALKRILTRERWAAGGGSSSSAAGEIDIERGEEQCQRRQ
ncbi:hypothetical protein ACLOJK_026309 [Asimina triloba]